MIAGSEFIRLERECQQKQSLSNGHAGETLDAETQNYLSIEASIKSTMQLFIKFSAGIILDAWNESNRSVHFISITHMHESIGLAKLENQLADLAHP